MDGITAENVVAEAKSHFRLCVVVATSTRNTLRYQIDHGLYKVLTIYTTPRVL